MWLIDNASLDKRSLPQKRCEKDMELAQRKAVTQQNRGSTCSQKPLPERARLKNTKMG